MRRLCKTIAALAVTIIGAALASASELPRTPSYGTGVFFDQGKTLTAGDFSVITEGKATILEKDEAPGGTSMAEATATAERLGLGFLLVDNITGRMGGAQAASGYTVKGLPEGAVAPGLRFSIAGKAVAKDTGAVNVTLTVLDYRGNLLAEITFTGERIVNEETGAVFEKDSFAGMFCPDPIRFTGSCNDPDDPVKQKTVWFSGAGLDAVLPLVLPVLKDNGIIVELWGSTDSTIELDFRDAVTLTGSPPDGVVVTLSTGQIFGSTK